MSFFSMMELGLKGLWKEKKIKYIEKNVQNLYNTVKSILSFCNKMPNKRPDDPTGILAWKVSLPLRFNKAIDQLFTRSIEKVLINN